MEILEPARSHPKQFNCKCGCTFTADKNKEKRGWRDGGMNWPLYTCPECHRSIVDREEATEEFEIRLKIVESDASIESQRKANSWWNRLFGGNK